MKNPFLLNLSVQRVCLALMGLILSQCATKEVDMSDPAVAFQQIKTWYYDEEYFDEAINKFNEFKSKYPYNKYTTQAELLIADAYYTQEKWPEASVSYEEFVKLHPRHAKYAFALFRDANCFYNQRNSTIDRDQSPTKEAIEKFRKYLSEFPDGEYAATSRESLNLCVDQLADHAQFIADFYMWKDYYHSALHKYLKIVDAWPEKADHHGPALVNAALCYYELIKQKKKDPESDKNRYIAMQSVQELKTAGIKLIRTYNDKYAQGSLKGKANGILSKLNSI